MFGNEPHPGFTKITLNAMRVGFGLLFMQHGAQKLFGWFGREPVELMSQMGLAGILEFFGGALIVIGLLTRPVAALLAVQMLWAYIQAHAPNGWVPIVNRGELALLYMFAWAFIAAHGGGSVSVDGMLAEKKRNSVGG